MDDVLLKITSVIATLSVVVLTVLVIGLYLLPAIVAFRRKKQNRLNVALFTVLLGWTGVIWVAMLVDAFKNDNDP